MSPVRRFAPTLAFCGFALGLVLVGWVARYSSAQNPSQELPPQPAPNSEALPQPEGPKTAPQQSKPAPSDPALESLPARDPADSAAAPQPYPEQGAPVPFPVKTNTKEPLARVTVVTPDGSAADAEDPEKVANAFLEQNQKLAETQLKALQEEAEKLKARLSKVEAGIKRWNRLLQALKISQGAATVIVTPHTTVQGAPSPSDGPVLNLPPSAPGEDPTELSPVPRGPSARNSHSPPDSIPARDAASKRAISSEAKAIEKDLGIN